MNGKMKDKLCDCIGWTRCGNIPLLTSHHPDCSCYSMEIVKLLENILTGIEAWAADEDGIHPEVWGAYLQIRYMLGYTIPNSEDG